MLLTMSMIQTRDRPTTSQEHDAPDKPHVPAALLALGLFLLSPIVAEFLLGNLPITAFYALVILAPLYGAGAVLVREIARHAGRGWPTIVILALAYGVLEEGITTMSLFNPNYAGQRLLDFGYIPALGMGVPWTVFVLTLHTVWSISVPILVMEVLAGDRRTTPWLGPVGLALTGVVFLFGIAANTFISVMAFHFVASPAQLIGTVVAAAALIWLGLALPARNTRAPAQPRLALPNPWVVGLLSLGATSAFKLLPRDVSPALYVGGVLLLALVAIVVIRYWAASPGWSDAHRLALGAGALLTYAWAAFPQQPMLPATPAQDVVGNAVFAVAAIGLVAFAAYTVRKRDASYT